MRIGALILGVLLSLRAEARTVEEVVTRYGPTALARLKPRFEKAQVAYPPSQVALLAFKQERRVELWAPSGKDWKRVHSYEVFGASGMAGPKLREGDLQVPEGVYPILFLNPNSSYHLSMKVGYPRPFDLRQAKADKRSRLGGDIFIHGKDVSIGCLALGDPAIEELFVLAAAIGVKNFEVVIAPVDFRKVKDLPPLRYDPPWLPELYGEIRGALSRFPVPASGE